jgi:hypothetical protein
VTERLKLCLFDPHLKNLEDSLPFSRPSPPLLVSGAQPKPKGHQAWHQYCSNIIFSFHRI